MSNNEEKKIKYVYELPYFERMELCRILDQHDKWEELGGVHMKFDMMTIHSLRREVMRGNSPTDELLVKWGHKNHTITELFALLSRMQHYQAMVVLKDFVSPEYHRLIYEGEQNLSSFVRKVSNNKPTAPTTISASLGNEAAALPEADVNINMSQSNNMLPEKMQFSTQPQVSDEKILNVQLPKNSTSSHRSHAQTVLVAPPSHNPRSLSPNLGIPLPERDVRLTNASNVSSIAECMGTLPMIPFKELEIATNGWESSNILGKGGFGTVYKGVWKNTYVAIKRTRNTESDANQTIQIQQILGELKMLNSCRHDNILPLYGFSVGGEDPCLISQFMPHGSLEDRLQCRQGSPPLSWQQRHYIATGTARGLQFLHTMGDKPLIHGDIKSGNILLDSNFEPRIGDFGLAREGPYNHYTHMKVSRVHGTRPYLPDEFLRAKKLSTKVDTYSFGVVLFELASGQRAYDDQRTYKFLKDHVENNEKQLEVIIDKKAGPDELNVFVELVKLGQKCVSKRPKDRPEMVTVLEHLNLVSATRDMAARVQQMMNQNSFSPSNPYERQLLHDFSQQRRLSGSSSIPRTTSPLPPSISPIPPSLSPLPPPLSIREADRLRTPSPNNPFVYQDIHTKGTISPQHIARQNETVLSLQEIQPHRTVSPNPFIIKPSKLIEEETPKIAISPPSGSTFSGKIFSTSMSINSDNGLPENNNSQCTTTETHELDNQESFSYVDTVLPLISVLGVKNPEPQVPPDDVPSTARGKVPWILSGETSS